MRLIALLLLLTLAAFPQGKGSHGKGKGKGKGHQDSPAAAREGAVVFSEADRRAIQDWARQTQPAGLPPGLDKRGELPPGLQKHLQRGGTLPPGLQKKISRFPAPLAGRLTPLPEGYDRVFLDGKALIVSRASQSVLDVLSVF